MENTSNHEYPNWTLAHDLALICLALSHGTDEELDSSEVDAMSLKLSQWHAHFNIETVKQIMRDVMLVYVGSSGDPMLEASIASIASELSKPSRIAILNDLTDIATADGSIVMGEVDFIQQLARDWGIERDVQ